MATLYKTQRIAVLNVMEQLFQSLPTDDRQKLSLLAREVGLPYAFAALRGELTSGSDTANFILSRRKMRLAALKQKQETHHANQVGS